ncbi:MAG: ATP-binding protein, partial [Myxococcota bacterium]
HTLGDGEGARRAFEAALHIAQTLAAREPERADYQRLLSVSHELMGDLLQALGDGAGARRAFEAAMRIHQSLSAREPERADYQRDLSVSYNRMGGLRQALGDGAGARCAFEAALHIAQTLAEREPERADYQRDLIVSFVKLQEVTGDTSFAEKALQIAIRMSDNGTLSPSDAWMVDELRTRAGGLPDVE